MNEIILTHLRKMEFVCGLKQFKEYECKTERSKYLRDLGIPLNTDSTVKGQFVFLAERASELFHDNIITDRTVGCPKTVSFTQSCVAES